MEIIADSDDFLIEQSTAVAIGKFDGVHIGHRRLLEEILSKKSEEVKACVFTFNPPPEVLFGKSDGRELMTPEEKREAFQKMGVDILIEFPLTKETAAISPEEFVKDILVRRMGTVFVAAGTDLSFGAGGKGDASLLREMAPEYGFAVKTIDKVRAEVEGSACEVSSTLLRQLLREGKMEVIEQLMGAPYKIDGEILHGRHLGHTLGFPTINIVPPATKLLPPFGVYTTEVRLDGKMYHGVSNVGCKPTVSQEKQVGVETYLYDFDEDVYGRTAEVFFGPFRRPEQTFSGPEALRQQLMLDIEESRR